MTTATSSPSGSLPTTPSPSCPQCGGSCTLHFQTQDYNRHISDEHFDHHRCTRCELLFIHPIPSDLGRYYPPSYHHIPETVAFLEENHGHEIYKIDLIRPFMPAGRLLEIGPSMGTFAYAAKKAGYEVNTIEMSEDCSRYLNEVAQIPTVNTSDTDAALQTLEPFDVIALWHVIEHLPDPWTTLKNIADCLKPGGICVIAAPNPDAFQFHVMGRWWPHVDAPRHLLLIPQNVLVERAKALGLRLEMATTDDEGARGWNTFGWEYWLGNLTRRRRVGMALHKAGRALATLMKPFDQREGRGSAYTLVFRRDTA